MSLGRWMAFILSMGSITATGCRCFSPLQSDTGAQRSQRVEQMQSLTKRYAGTVDAHTSGAAAMANLAQADRLMAEWGAINFRIEDVKALFGRPTSESVNQLEYRFDDGYGGALWRFRAESGRIMAVERIPLE